MSTTNRPPSIYVDDVFDEILALPDDRREAAIEARCAGHPSIAAEVRALLNAEAQIAKDAPVPLRPGEQIGRYHLAQCLGTGASASVWKAFDTHLEAWTALKLIHPEFSRRPNALDTVMNEARAASGIISDHVVRSTDGAEVDYLLIHRDASGDAPAQRHLVGLVDLGRDVLVVDAGGPAESFDAAAVVGLLRSLRVRRGHAVGNL